MRRFGVPQKGSVRGVDDAHENWANFTSARTEKLVTSSVDMIVNLIKEWVTVLKKEGIEPDLGAWALDELKAYRQIPVQGDQRKFSVIAVVNPNKDPNTGIGEPKVEYFVLNGHAFGFTNAVYNYNRRPWAVGEILRRLFRIPTDHYYDDRWAFEPMATIQSSFTTTTEVFKLLGIRVQDDKAQGPATVEVEQEDGSTKTVETESKDNPWKDPDLLGVRFDLAKFEVKVKPGRKAEIEEEIRAILLSGRLAPGHASKLKGRLFFLTCSLFGRIGRSLMRLLSERQYEYGSRPKKRHRDEPKIGKAHALNPALRETLRNWLSILDRGRPRPIGQRRDGPADAVLFTDGAGPTSEEPNTIPKVGGVMFAWWRGEPAAFEKVVPWDYITTWLPRENQIALIELFGACLAIAHFGPEPAGKRVTMLIDSQCALDALIKGQSKFKDVIKILRVFWDLVAEYHIELYLDRVSSDANPADGMSRDGRAEAEAMGWRIEHARFPDELR